MVIKMIDFAKIEKKWQKRWEQKKAFVVRDNVKGKKNYYMLEMYPYPSGSGLHVGHAFNYSIGDIYARLRRMQGYNVLYPMGYDSFGLPAENAAIEAKAHPKKFTEGAIKNYIKQMKSIGLSYDWSRILMSHDPDYYRWDQWIFLKMFERGLAYRKKAPVNWCPKCKTVLANEQVIGGKCWRHDDTDVIIKQLEQWFLKITDYADELYEDIGRKLQGWPEQTKKLQKNWIGKSQGTEIDFEVDNGDKKINYVLVHGYTGSPKENFFPWLKKHLLNERNRVSVPKLPNTENPKVMDQVNYVLKNEKFDENTVLLGHSLGSAVALKVVENLKHPIKKLVLAAGFLDPVFEDKERPFAKTFNWEFDFEKIKKNVEDIVILRASNDSAVGKSHADKIRNAIGGKIVDFKAKDDHIRGIEEPIVLDNCLIKGGGKKWSVFTTRPDTLFGVTFLVVSAQHPDLMTLVSDDQRKKVDSFLKKIKSTKDEDLHKLDKEGVFTGSCGVHPLTGEKVPIWTGNFVVADYGSGMVMAVPAHDQRDFEFANRYKLPIKMVVCPHYPKTTCPVLKEAYTGFGHLVDSEGFNGLKSQEAKEHITNALKIKRKGKKAIGFRLRDWLISRQRFWGTPIPIIYCDDCGVVAVEEKDLPVKLPDNIKFTSAENPLKRARGFVKVKCPKCGKQTGKRETDTMDTFANSSWYFLRYLDPKNRRQIFDKKKAEHWMPIDQYIGGVEHACLHLIYFRFYTKFLRDLGLLKIDEPAVRLFNQGMLHGPDGQRMSKSKGNVVFPESVSNKYGIDAARMFLVSIASPDKDINWSDKGAEGSLKFVLRVMNFVKSFRPNKMSKLQESKMHRTVKDYTSDIEEFRYNLAVIKLRELFDVLEEGCDKKSLKIFLQLFSPICPHVSEELWSKLGNKSFISLSKWPKFDKKKINDKLEQEAGVVEKTVLDIKNILRIIKEKQDKKGKKAYLYVLPPEKKNYDGKILGERLGMDVAVYSVADKEKHDPEGKSKKVKPGRPGIYVELAGT